MGDQANPIIQQRVTADVDRLGDGIVAHVLQCGLARAGDRSQRIRFGGDRRVSSPPSATPGNGGEGVPAGRS